MRPVNECQDLLIDEQWYLILADGDKEFVKCHKDTPEEPAEFSSRGIDYNVLSIWSQWGQKHYHTIQIIARVDPEKMVFLTDGFV